MGLTRRSTPALLLVLLAACGLDVGLFGEDAAEQRERARFDVPSCIAATGTDGAGELEDETGRASVVTSGTECARTFSVSSTAARRDNLPAGPRIVREREDRPSVQTKSPLFDALFQLALDEATENSVSAIADGAFNDGAQLRCPDGGCFETGRKWTYVWTRDTAYASHLGLGWIDPVRAKNSLEFKLSTRRDRSDVQIVQDTGTGGSYPISSDRAVWALGAGEILEHLTGDARVRFRDNAFAAAKNTVEHDRAVVFDPRDGLYRGEQSFLDWREQTYPAWTVPDTAHIGMSKSLSTNLAHLALIDLAGTLASETGDGATAATMKSRATALRAAIRAHFWLEKERQLSTFLTTELDPSPVLRSDLLGTSLAVLLDATSPEEARAAIAGYPTFAKGPPVVFPQQQDTAIYHNRAIWPFVTAYWAKAARKVGNDAAFDAALRSLVRGAALNLSNMENLEAVSGKPFVEDGPYSGPVVNSQRQLWSVAGYVGAVVGGVFGVDAATGGVRVAPFVTRGLHASLLNGARSIVLNNLPLRGKKLSVVVRLPAAEAGAGAYDVVRLRFNGVERATPFVADDELAERNLFEVELGAPRGKGEGAKTIADVSDYRSIYAPRTPSVAVSTGRDGTPALLADFAGENAADITWSVLRDGQRVASGLSAMQPSWRDTGASAGETHCYSVETRWVSSGNASHHAPPSCFWGPGAERISAVRAADFSVTGGNLVTSFGRTFYEAWGDPGDEIAATFAVTRSGPHLVQAVYANGSGGLNTGITCAVKHVTVEELASGAIAGEGYLVMPQRGDWGSWGDSSFVRAELAAGKTYRVRLSHDRRSVNMSTFEHFASYTGGTGGRSGSFFRVNVAELKLLALVR